MAIYVPTLQTDYIRQGLLDASDPVAGVDNRHLAALIASGAVAVNPPELAALGNGGDSITIPAPIDPTEPIHADYTSATPMAAVTPDASTDKAIVAWRSQLYAWTRAELIRAGTNWGEHFQRKLGGVIAKCSLKRLLNVAIAAVDAVDTPSADYHTSSVWTGAGTAKLTVERIRVAKAKLGDHAQYLDTLVTDSDRFADLVKDVVTSYGLSPNANDALRSNFITELLGIRRFVITDDMPQTTTGVGSTQNNKFNTLLFGRDAMMFGFQLDPTTLEDRDITLPVTKFQLKVEYSAVYHLRYVQWSAAGVNPVDADLATTSNYNEGFDTGTTANHKRVRCVKLVTD